jgi:hypothetical protein
LGFNIAAVASNMMAAAKPHAFQAAFGNSRAKSISQGDGE